MLRIWLFSDLHLERVSYPDGYEVDRPEFDVIVSPGDVWKGEVERGFAFLAKLAKGKPVVATLGNHEHFGGEVFETIRYARELAKQYGITLLQDSTCEIGGVTFAGGTLWADGVLGGAAMLANAVTGEDIRVVTNIGEQALTNGAVAQIHRHSREILTQVVRTHDRSKPLVVVTHHAPHPDCLHPDYSTGFAAGNSASDLTDLTDAGVVSLWCHGHVHQSLDFRRPGGTRIICNPAGRNFENANFLDALVVKVEAPTKDYGLIPSEYHGSLANP